MRGSATIGAAALGLSLVLSLGLSVRPASGEGVTVALTPNMVEVPAGALFDLDITVTEAGSAFNGFNAVIGFDPAAVTCVPRDPLSLQEGRLMRDACATRFHRFEQGADSDTIGDFLLCNGVSVTGPGQIYHLQFRASETPQVTRIRFLAGLRFYNDGVYVLPIHAMDAIIGIGVPPADAGMPLPPGGVRASVAPNPARGPVAVTVETDRGGPMRISLVDARGGLVRRLDDAFVLPGIRVVSWDGRDARGRTAPAGIYFVSIEAPGRHLAERIAGIRCRRLERKVTSGCRA